MTDQPVPLDDAIARVRRTLGMPDAGALERIVAAWPSIVGATLAPLVRPAVLRDGVLTVVASAPAYAAELRYLEDRIVAEACAAAGPGTVRGVRIRLA